MIGETIAHYRILGHLGRGGMGVVYEAQDVVLGRKIAIKFLGTHSEDSSDAAKRLQREARILSALNHPNICTLYELGEHQGLPYLVEELLLGATFQEVIESRTLAPDFILDLAIQIAEGLKAAHAIGLVHRDIKPANLFLTQENRAKILDFGLARQTPVLLETSPDAQTMAGDSDQITHPGRIVGTLDYMSPEQVRGETATASSDIFSLGIVLYELLYQRHPFKKKSPLETASAILMSPLDSSISKEMAMSGLNLVLVRMLAKELAGRYVDGGALLEDLKRLQLKTLEPARAGASGFLAQSPAPSVAVLPFANLSADVENEYFCEGLAEELVGALSKIEGLQVAAWNSAFRFRGDQLDIREVGQQLGVNAVLEGSLRKSGTRLRVNVKLLEAKNGFSVWSERYDRELQDVFVLQEEIAGAIAGQLRVKLGLKGEEALVRPPTHNLEAYNLFLKGRYFWNRRGPADIQKALQSFDRALAKDANFTAALSGLADCHVISGVQGSESPQQAFSAARQAAARALALDPAMAEAWVGWACVEAVYEWNWAEAELSFQKAIALNPRYGTAHHWYATHLLIPLGRFAEARAQMELARANDPLSLAIQITGGLISYFEGDADRAIADYQKALEMDASFGLAHYFLGQAYAQKQWHEKAIRSLTGALEFSPGSSEIEASLGHARAAAGDRDGAGAMLEKLRQKAESRYVSPVLLAQVLIGLNRNEEGIIELERGRQVRATDLVWLKVRPAFEAVRSDRRVQAILSEVKLR